MLTLMINTLQTQITFKFQGEHDHFLKILWAINSNHVIPITCEQIFDCKTFKGKKSMPVVLKLVLKAIGWAVTREETYL